MSKVRYTWLGLALLLVFSGDWSAQAQRSQRQPRQQQQQPAPVPQSGTSPLTTPVPPAAVPDSN